MKTISFKNNGAGVAANIHLPERFNEKTNTLL